MWAIACASPLRYEEADTMDKYQNLRPFNTLPQEEHRELSRRGGIASGERRRYLADLRLAMIENIAGRDLAIETRAEYRQAIRRYVKEEQRKAVKRKRHDHS